MNFNVRGAGAVSFLALVAAGAVSVGAAQAQSSSSQETVSTQVSGVTVTGQGQHDASLPQYNTPVVTVGPLGPEALLDTPQSITTVPQDLIVNQQTRNVNDTLRFLPSVEIRDQQGFEVSRPQSRGFQSSIAQNTRLDGLNVIGTTAIAAENLSGIEVFNGPSGALFGPESPAGTFNYMLKRPTDKPLLDYTEGFQSDGIFTEAADMGGRFGPDDKLGVRLNIVHGEGESYVEGSNVNRTLAALDVDYHLDSKTVVEADYSHYETEGYGLPGSIVYDGASTSASSKSSLLPKAPDPTQVGLGQPGAGTDLRTETVLGKVKHEINSDWSFEVGGLYQNAIRGLFGITNTLTNNVGAYTVTKNFTAVPQFTIGSNSAYLNGHIRLFGFLNDVTLGTNGFINGQYSHANTNFPVTLGSANLADPVVFPTKPQPNPGKLYESGRLFEQSIIMGDTLHLNEQVAVQAVINTSFLHSESWSSTGAITSNDKHDGAVSPTVSLLYKPLPSLTLHATWAQSIEQGDQASANSPNANQFLAPYQDEEYEVGAKYAVSPNMLVTLDAFHMTRPFATNVAPTNLFEVVGEQRNNGVEAFIQGEATPDLSVFGGVTYIDARLEGSDNPLTTGRRIVGVPEVKSDLVFDYHPGFARGGALTMTVNYESDRAATDTNNSYAPAYVTIDPGVRYGFDYAGHRITARFQVLNATDTHYYVSIADGAIVGSPGANTAYLGGPRTYEASLDLQF
ncbi:MAG: TonB-dependent receptor [Caulobacteraceae bacterium]